jgi:hypothetical protein
MSVNDPGTPTPPLGRDDELLENPDQATTPEDESRPTMVDPSGEQILPEELPEVDQDPGNKAGVHDRAGDSERVT